MDVKRTISIFSETVTSLRVIIFTMGICCLMYGSIILIFAQIVTPYSADGSLICNDNGEVLGSKLIAQGFSADKYLWPRPSAVDYNASASGGSNLSPANQELRSRAQGIITRLNFQGTISVPADLLTASGSGLDPHITLRAAQVQSERIAGARGLSTASIMKLLEESSMRTGGLFASEPLVNVLDANSALDRMGK